MTSEKKIKKERITNDLRGSRIQRPEWTPAVNICSSFFLGVDFEILNLER